MRPPGQDKAVVVGGVGLGNFPVHGERVAVVEVIEGPDLAGFDGEKLRLPAGFLDGLPGLGQLDLLDSVSREKCDLLSL